MVDRETLIDAVVRDCMTTRHWASLAVDAVLPQIAQALEAKRDEHFQEYGNEEPSHRGEDWGYTRSTALVRSLGGNDRSSDDD